MLNWLLLGAVGSLFFELMLLIKIPNAPPSKRELLESAFLALFGPINLISALLWFLVYQRSIFGNKR